MAVYRTFEISADILVLACIAAAPLSLFRRVRSSVASLYLFSCLILGFFLWIDAGLFVLDIWGRPWVLFGILLFLFAVIPEAFVACITAHRWLAASEIPIIIGVMILLRVAAGFFAAPARLKEPQLIELPKREPPPEPSKTQTFSPDTLNSPMAPAPENPATLATQTQELVEGKRRVVMYPNGTPPPTTFPQNSAVTSDKYGNIYVFRPDLITRSAIKKAAENNMLPEILG